MISPLGRVGVDQETMSSVGEGEVIVGSRIPSGALSAVVTSEGVLIVQPPRVHACKQGNSYFRRL